MIVGLSGRTYNVGALASPARHDIASSLGPTTAYLLLLRTADREPSQAPCRPRAVTPRPSPWSTPPTVYNPTNGSSRPVPPAHSLSRGSPAPPPSPPRAQSPAPTASIPPQTRTRGRTPRSTCTPRAQDRDPHL